MLPGVNGAAPLAAASTDPHPTHPSSARKVYACGFTLEAFLSHRLKIAGRWRDHERWVLLADA